MSPSSTAHLRGELPVRRKKLTLREIAECTLASALREARYWWSHEKSSDCRQAKDAFEIALSVWRPRRNRFLVWGKWRRKVGSGDETIPFDVICLTKAVLERPEGFARAYLVLGGLGWKMHDFYVSGGPRQYLVRPNLVRIVSLKRVIPQTLFPNFLILLPPRTLRRHRQSPICHHCGPGRTCKLAEEPEARRHLPTLRGAPHHAGSIADCSRSGLLRAC